MAQLKDLVVTGKTRLVGTVYANKIVGDVEGIASESASAVNDSNGQQIDETYVKSIGVDGRVLTYTKGDNSQQQVILPDPASLIDNGTDIVDGLTKLYPSTGTHTDGTITQKGITELLDTKLDANATAEKATADANGNNIAETYVQNISANATTVTFTKGDGSTVSFQTQDTTYDQATSGDLGLVKIQATTGTSETDVMTQKATTDAITALGNTKVNKDEGLVGASVDNKSITFTKGDGSTFSFDTYDTTYEQATDVKLGLVKLYANSGENEDGAMTQKAVGEAIAEALESGVYATHADKARKDVNGKPLTSYGASLSVDGRDVSLVDSLGNVVSTVQTQDTTYEQATDTTLGLVKIVDVTGQSTTDTMSQKAISEMLAKKLSVTGTAASAYNDAVGQPITDYIQDVDVNDRVLTFHRGNLSTFSREISGQATDTTMGVVRIQGSTGTSTTDVMTQKAVTDELNTRVEHVALIKNNQDLRKLTFTKGDGSTAEYDLSYAQATDNIRGLVKIQASTGTSTTDVMTQKATTDEVKARLMNDVTMTKLDDDTRVLHFTKGDGTTYDRDLSYQQATSTVRGLVKIQASTGTSTTDVMTQKAASDAINDKFTNVELTSATGDTDTNRTLTFTKGNGSTMAVNLAYQQASDDTLGLVKIQASTGTSTTDVMDQNVTTTELKARLMNDVTMTKLDDDTRVLHFTKGDGSTYDRDLSYQQATSTVRGLVKIQASTGTSTTDVMTQKASSDAINDKYRAIALSKETGSTTTDRTLTFTKGNGSTEAFDLSYQQAADDTLGLVKIQASTGTSTTDVMTQKATTDAIVAMGDGKVANVTLTKDDTGVRKLLYTNGNGSTYEHDLSFAQATASKLGLVKIQASTGTSETDVMTQKATTDEVKARLMNDVVLTKDDTGVRKLKFTKGNGSTYEHDISFAQATADKLGLVKINSSTGTSTTGVMTQKAVTDELNTRVESVDLTKDDTGVRKLTFTKGDGSTAEYDLSFAQATASKLGLVKIQATTGTSITDVMTQKATTDEVKARLMNTITLTKDDSGVRKLKFTKGDASTVEYDMSFAQATDNTLGLVKIQASTGTSVTDVMTQKAVTDELNTRVESVDLTKDDTGVRKLLYTNGNGSTYEHDLSFAQATSSKLGLVKISGSSGTSTTAVMTQKATTDVAKARLMNEITFTKDDTGVRKLTFTKGDSSTVEYDLSFAQATASKLGLVKINASTGTSTTGVMTQKAVTDELNTRVESVALTKDDTGVRKFTFTKGDGSTSEYDISFAQATASKLGLVKIQGSTGTSTTDVMTQKATTDEVKARLMNDITLTSDDTGVRKLTFTKGDGSTYERNLSFAQATASKLGLVKIQATTGTSTTDVMTQKAASDAINDKYNTVTMTNSGATRKLKFTKGNGSTVEHDLSYSQATASALGLVKIQASTGTSTTDVMTQKATTDALSTLKSDIEDKMSKVFSAVIVDSFDDLPTIGDGRYLYLVPNNKSISSNVYDEYVWVVDDATSGDGHYELFGISTIDLDPYYTANQTTAAIKAATDGNVVNLTASGRTITFTKKDGSTGTFTTQDTTYVDYTASTSGANGKNGLVPAPTSAQMNYVLTGGGKWTAKAPNAINADTATYAVNAGTAVSASKDSAGQQINTTYIKNASVSGRAITFTKGDGSTFSFNTQDTTYSNMTPATTAADGAAGFVPKPTKSQTAYFLTGAGWATNVGTAAYATKSGTATYATNAGTAAQATHATNADTATYGTNAGTAVSASKDSAGQQIDTTYLKAASVSAKVITFTKGDGSTFSITTQDNNTTYANMTAATTAAAGKAGLVPAPTAAQYNYFLTGHGWATNVGTAAYATNSGTATHASTADYATNAGTATYGTNAGTAAVANNDSDGQQINTTYIKNASVSGRAITFTKGDGSTFSFNTQDNNTTYADMGNATTAANGTHGLVPAPTKDQYNYVLSGHGWINNITGTVSYATNAGTATYANKSGTATYSTNSGTAAYGTKAGTATHATNADTATYANSAGKATKDSADQQINTTYIKNASVSGKVVTFTKGDGSTFSITTQDSNTTYGAMTAATTAADGAAGLVPKPTKSQTAYFLTGAGWATNVGTAAYATNSGTATYATNAGTAVSASKDSAGQQINTTYLKNASVSGRTVTFTKGDGSTFSITTQDNNTTYGAMTAATTAADGAAGLVPKPTKSQTAYFLTGAGWATNVGTAAYATNAGTATHANDAVTTATVSGKTVTFTKGNGGTFSITTQDTNTTYADMTAATTAANGAHGLVPAPTSAQYNYVLSGHGWVSKANNAATADYATNAGTAAYGTKSGTATYATNAGTAASATKDSAGQQINTTYVKSASVSGKVVTFTRGDGSTFSITTQDNNTTYADMTAATTAADGAHGLVPKPTKSQTAYFLTGAGWATNVGTAAYATNAGTATHATKSGTATYANSAGAVAWGNVSGKPSSYTPASHTHAYISTATVSGRTVTFTRGDGSTFTITTQDSNTTYGNMTAASASAAGTAGLVPAPSKGYQNYVLSGAGWVSKAANAGTADYATNAGTATHATNAGTATHATNAGTAAHANDAVTAASVSGKVITFTKGNGGTFSITTQDSNTTYADMTAATTAADGAHGLVPKPTKSQVAYYLTGAGWATNVGTAAYATKSGTATYGTNAGTAVSATKDSVGNQINTTYLKNASVSGKTVTFTKGNGSTFSITTQDTNTTYANMTAATTAAAGKAGLVPAPTAAQYNYFLTGHGWATNVGTAAYATKSGTATYASSAGAVAWGNVSGKPSTYTAGAISDGITIDCGDEG